MFRAIFKLLKAKLLMQQKNFIIYLNLNGQLFETLPVNMICPVLIQSSIHFLLRLTISVEMHFLAHILISCFQHFHFSVTVIWPGSRRQDSSQVTDVSLSPPPYSVPPLTITLTKETSQELRMLSRSLSDCKSLCSHCCHYSHCSHCSAKIKSDLTQ